MLFLFVAALRSGLSVPYEGKSDLTPQISGEEVYKTETSALQYIVLTYDFLRSNPGRYVITIGDVGNTMLYNLEVRSEASRICATESIETCARV
jgi:hypothetical protein